MIDVSGKSSTLRTARARARLTVARETISAIREGRVPKGDPLMVARVAGTQAAKNTQLLIPYCHSLPLDYVGIDFALGEDSVEVCTEVKAVWKTGVEMEAMTAATVAALTLYDMLKMIDAAMEIRDVRLEAKTGGKSDFRHRFDRGLRAAVLVLSDSVASGSKKDTAGEAVSQMLTDTGVIVDEIAVLPDDKPLIISWLRRASDEDHLDFVITTGGTGLGPRDVTPEATRSILDREIPGLAEIARYYGSARTPHSVLSRALAGQRGTTIIVNLPGSERGATESLHAMLPALLHACQMVNGAGHLETFSRSITS